MSRGLPDGRNSCRLDGNSDYAFCFRVCRMSSWHPRWPHQGFSKLCTMCSSPSPRSWKRTVSKEELSEIGCSPLSDRSKQYLTECSGDLPLRRSAEPVEDIPNPAQMQIGRTSRGVIVPFIERRIVHSSSALKELACNGDDGRHGASMLQYF